MKFVYVLTCSDKDLYYEQFVLSVYSLRIFNHDAEIVVLMDRKTKDHLKKRNFHENIVTEIKILDTDPSLNQKEVSRWIKTSIGNIISDDFLFIDCDTIICDKLDVSFSDNIIVGAVLDTHVRLSQHYLKSIFQNDSKILGFSCPFESDLYFNGGLLYCKNHELTRTFFKKWHSLWNKSRELGNSQDMPSLNQTNFELGNVIQELDGIWNCQITHNGLPFLNNAKIIHYYATSLSSFTTSYLLASAKILNSIKDTGALSNEIKALLANPRAAFSYNSRIIADQVVFDILESAFFSKLLWLRRNHEKIFWKLNSIINHIKKPSYLIKSWLQKK